jgi:hypothetical protein
LGAPFRADDRLRHRGRPLALPAPAGCAAAPEARHGPARLTRPR